ncbi:hypothetical protein RRF57_011987 [Xylaria bambusicola]|uniref:Uncharacterized protein n=1 Tax=Xylaria bambusicola TaxID=326684 RepID=A0AAN7Z463_9PEZI
MPEIDTSTLNHAATESTPKKDVISGLEDRYIQLLEAKIAHLEAKIEFHKPASAISEVGGVILLSTPESTEAIEHDIILIKIQDGDSPDEVDLEIRSPTGVTGVPVVRTPLKKTFRITPALTCGCRILGP